MKLNSFLWVSLTFLNLLAVPTSYAAIHAETLGFALQAESVLVSQTQSVAIATGAFVANEKPTTGTARIVQEGNNRYLELDRAFSTSNQGPDLQVLLDTSTTPPASYANLTGTINLGGLQSYSGSQRYAIPENADVSSFKSVVIWCRMANATFGHAVLTPTP